MMSVSTDIENPEALPSSNLGDTKGVPAWKKGQVIRLTKDYFLKNEWCKGCELKILVDATESGYYHVMA